MFSLISAYFPIKDLLDAEKSGLKHVLRAEKSGPKILIDSTIMLKSGEIFVNPWSTSTITNLLQKMKAKLSKYKGIYSNAKTYPGKVALSTLAKSVRNKVIIDIGKYDVQIWFCSYFGRSFMDMWNIC
ncbi:hypothetical protein POM88_041037 [Heracleum sosnowskyi]|uniref:Uncharacterized protein n=1 Tax=Heracleum sosnowskyi TaxID=360622 RepID=A0AAD8M9C7_9APIA|nr:hypothetical protein POM88_041037 [Heracleum sosnowskyi]